ncbi:MAG: hypothetical protein AAF825_06220 [Pseudomonadota bacterium]
MTNTVALWIGGLLFLALALDAVWFGWNLPLISGRLLIDLLTWLAFWR